MQASESAPTSTSQSGVSVEPQLKTSQESPQLEEILNWGRSLICQMLQISHVADVRHVDDLQFKVQKIMNLETHLHQQCQLLSELKIYRRKTSVWSKIMQRQTFSRLERCFQPFSPLSCLRNRDAFCFAPREYECSSTHSQTLHSVSYSFSESCNPA